jgi:hypothetical protein
VSINAHVTFEIRGWKPERELAVLDAFAQFVKEETEGFISECRGPPLVIKRIEPLVARARSQQLFRISGSAYESMVTERLGAAMAKANGGPCQVIVCAIDPLQDAEVVDPYRCPDDFDYGEDPEE